MWSAHDFLPNQSLPGAVLPPWRSLSLCFFVALGWGLLASEGRADEWTDCDPNFANKVEQACTAVIEKAERSPQDLASAYARRGDLYRSRAMPDRAFADFAEALRRDPNSWEAHFDRGLAFRDKNQLDEALADLDRAIELAPQRPNPHIAARQRSGIAPRR